MSFKCTTSKIKTVKGWISPEEAGITDAHNHVWIEPIIGVDAGAPTLTNKNTILDYLKNYRNAGGGSIVDCQPGGCGRNGDALLRISEETGVHIIACTGYHLQKYYQENYWLFTSSIDKATTHFLSELNDCLSEAQNTNRKISAGFIKIACQSTLDKSPTHLMEAAVNASLENCVAIQVHTERGSQAEEIISALLNYGISPSKLIICHVDKLPDYHFHCDLLSTGVSLEYDTFFRPKYDPENNLWPLLEKLIEAGFDNQIVVATDMAEQEQWSKVKNSEGLLHQIIHRFKIIGFDHRTIDRLVRENISSILAQQVPSND